MDRDRHVSDWIHSGKLHGVWGGGIMGIWALVAVMAGFPVPLREHPAILILVAVGLGSAAGFALGRAVLGASGAAAQQVYMPGNGGTYVVQHSHIDALEAQGNYAGAADAWEKVAIAEPHNPWPLIRAGELYLRTLKDPSMALERFVGARAVPGINAEVEMYASQKIIDLYLGPLGQDGRALVELRRFIERHAGTREAAHAREALARLKAERRAE
ncbi:MAG: hypothetical protein U9Q74_16700 [Gemmatimonadota bacterium]|nr:hypothetical protein [Gemmatimonadota bacterium]